jgi:hypothetical protein
MTSLEIYADGDRQTLRTLHVLDNAPNLIPDLFKDKDTHQVRWGEVVVATRAATVAGLDPVVDLKHFPVIRGAVFPMAEVWRVMARRHSWAITTPIDTDQRCVVHMHNLATGETPPDFEMSWDEARKLGNAAKNDLYVAIPRSMLRARATMTAIRLNAPDVLRDPATTGWAPDDPLPGGSPTSLPGQGTGAGRPEVPPLLAPAPTTPEDIGLLTTALAVIGQISPTLVDRTRTEWKAAGIPALRDLALDDPLHRVWRIVVPALLDIIAEWIIPTGSYDPEPDPDRDSSDSGGYRYDPQDGRPFLTGEETDEVGW